MTPLRKLPRKAVLLCARAVVVVAAVLLVAALPAPEPTFQDKPLSYWLDHLPSVIQLPYAGVGPVTLTAYITKPLPQVKLTNPLAVEAVKSVGARCFPTLLARLQTRNTRWTELKGKLQGWVFRIALTRPLAPLVGPPFAGPVTTVELRRGQAITAFVLLGETARSALPSVRTLARTSPDPGIRWSALEVLRRLSPADYAKVVAEQGSGKAAAR